MNAVGTSSALRGRINSTLRELHQEVGEYDQLVMQAHREGFIEACDLLGAPPADTPMERIALAGR